MLTRNKRFFSFLRCWSLRRGSFQGLVSATQFRTFAFKGVPEGAAIGYDARHTATRATRIATCPAGYNDGLPYALSNRGEAMVRGHRVPIVGSVTMDYVLLDVGDVPDAAVGDEVTLIGAGLKAEDLARWAGTIPYEVTCRLGKRVGRIAANAEQPMPAAFRVVA